MITAYSTLNKRDDVSLDTQLALGVVLVALSVYAVVAGDAVTTFIVASTVAAFCFAITVPIWWLERSLYTVIVVTCAWAIVQHIANVPPLAWTGNINFVGYLGAILALMIVSRSGAIWWPGLMIAVAALVVSRSTGAILCAALGVAYRYRDDRRVVALMVGSALVALLTNSFLSVLSRLTIWIAALQYQADLPYGATHTHNTFIQSIYAIGVLPTAIFAIPVSIVAWLLARSGVAAICALCWLAVSSSVDYLYWWPGIAALVVMYLVWSLRREVCYA